MFLNVDTEDSSQTARMSRLILSLVERTCQKVRFLRFGLVDEQDEKSKSINLREIQGDIIEALNSTSRYLDDLLTIDNIYFDQMVDRTYPRELHLHRANSS